MEEEEEEEEEKTRNKEGKKELKKNKKAVRDMSAYTILVCALVSSLSVSVSAVEASRHLLAKRHLHHRQDKQHEEPSKTVVAHPPAKSETKSDNVQREGLGENLPYPGIDCE